MEAIGLPLALEAAAASVPTALAALVRTASLHDFAYVNNFAADRGFATREALPMPSKPPYTAHLGNLSFDATEGDVTDFFADCEVTNVRIVEDKLDRKPKGFGYVEFGSVDGLKKALDLSGTSFQGRNIRVSVAEPRTLYPHHTRKKQLTLL
jgi:RNA recognition motif-containing protein